MTLPSILKDAVISGEDSSFDSSCAVTANLFDVNGDTIPEALVSIPDGTFYDESENPIAMVSEVALDVNAVGAQVSTINAKLVWTFATSTDVIHEMPFTIDIISCQDYLKVPIEL